MRALLVTNKGFFGRAGRAILAGCLLAAGAMTACGAVAQEAGERVVLQLRWDHEFQFAGYYAALWNGYYRDAGFDVDIRSAVQPDRSFLNATDEVSQGRAAFGVSGSDVLVAYGNGAELMVLAPVLQQSGTALYALSSVALATPSDLIPLRVARKPGDVVDNEVSSMLRSEGINPTALDYHPYRPGLEDLLARRVDVTPGRTLSIPWLARQAGVQLRSLRPITYGIDFYGDTLFTHRELVRKNPEQAERFRAASIKGWTYALENPEEIANRISAELPRTIPLDNAAEYNRWQATEIKALAVYPIIELGHMNPDRWRRMHELLTREGAIPRPFVMNEFIFDYRRLQEERGIWQLNLAAVGLAVLFAIGVAVILWNRSLRRQVATRTRELRLSEERFALAESGSNDGIWDWDLGSGRVYYSARFGELFGYGREEMGSHIDNWKRLVHPDDVPGVQRSLETHFAGRTPHYAQEYRFKHKDGSWRKVLGRAKALRDDRGKPYRMVGSLTDVTAQRALEQQLSQSQKMEAVGQLTGGLAHDFNNRLAAILANIELLDDHVRGNNEAHDLLASATRSAERGAELTRRLLVFSRQQELRPRSIDVNRTIMEMAQLLRRTLGETIVMETMTQDGLWRTNVDAGQLENAILNLALNARDAMPEGGKLILETANIELDAAYAARHADVRAGSYLLLAVTDTGTGMTPEVLARAFEPFFTTKSESRGSGLGLSMVYGFTKASGGHAKIYSESGIGTTVKLFLPKGEIFEAREAESSPTGRAGSPKESILVVEDDDDVRRSIEKLLENLGYRVTAVSDGPAALDVMRQAGPIDLLLTDVGLPRGMNGAELAQAARALMPRMKIVFMSGYTQGAFRGNDLLSGGAELVSKPFRKSTLERAVRRALDSK